MRPGPRRRQEGIVLMIALIMLVAMSLAGVALMRSVETAVIVAGNFAFKEAGVQVADRGVQEAARWLGVNSAGNTLYNDNPPAGYFSSLPPLDPDYFDLDNWGSSVLMNSGTPDASGNVGALRDPPHVHPAGHALGRSARRNAASRPRARPARAAASAATPRSSRARRSSITGSPRAWTAPATPSPSSRRASRCRSNPRPKRGPRSIPHEIPQDLPPHPHRPARRRRGAALAPAGRRAAREPLGRAAGAGAHLVGAAEPDVHPRRLGVDELQLHARPGADHLGRPDLPQLQAVRRAEHASRAPAPRRCR